MTMSTLNMAVSYHQNYNIVSLVNIWAWKKMNFWMSTQWQTKYRDNRAELEDYIWEPVIHLPPGYVEKKCSDWTTIPRKGHFFPIWKLRSMGNKMSNKMYNKSKLKRGLVVTIIKNYNKKVSNTGGTKSKFLNISNMNKKLKLKRLTCKELTLAI